MQSSHLPVRVCTKIKAIASHSAPKIISHVGHDVARCLHLHAAALGVHTLCANIYLPAAERATASLTD